jgi:hypothetical protein
MTRGTRTLRENEFEIDVSPLLQQPIQNTVYPSYSETDNTQEQWSNAKVPSPRSFGNLGSGRSDPFFQYPIRMGRRENELYDHRECHHLVTSFI